MLCVTCTQNTRQHLYDLPALYAALETHLAPSMAAGHGRRSTGGPAPLPVREDILDLRSAGGILGVLEDWHRAVRRDRRMHPPQTPGGIPQRLQRAVSALTAHMPWIVSTWPQAGTFAAEIRDLHRDVSSIVTPPDTDRGRHIGHCPAAYEDGVICGAVLRLLPGETVARCDWCETTWPPTTWMQLKAWQDEDAAAA
ncbi:hypothetical protein CP967_08530 [Streptomyces nitrosporeus]|uniref:Uncharacterized protein n=2 Tax=Streptomyces nitrosporeus TaxID=28894 RepID=A0A5J6FNF3_9ACTN|nr:hypothetical protein CP967_08530 [Streptomyces nitrosporeus]